MRRRQAASRAARVRQPRRRRGPAVWGRVVALAAISTLLACSTHRLASPRPAATTGAGRAAARAAGIGGLELLGEATLESGQTFEETVVGGLSGITYDAERDRYYAVSDDPSARSPARFYTLEIDLGSGSLLAGGARIEAVTLLEDRSGRPFARLVMDAEGIALTPHRTLLISAEGNVKRGVLPSLREFDLDGRELRQLAIPRRYRPRYRRPFGVRHNKVFEALAWSATGDGFHVAVENALLQDGPAADVGQPSPARILHYDHRRGKVVAEHVYRVEPVVEPPADPDAFRTNGLVELLALGDGELLALERSYTEGAGYSVRLFTVSTRGATDVRQLKRLSGGKAAAVVTVTKRPLLDLAELGIPLDNLEGLTFGPPLADGRRVLLLISDDNFHPEQRTQLLAFAVGGQPAAAAGR